MQIIQSISSPKNQTNQPIPAYFSSSSLLLVVIFIMKSTDCTAYEPVIVGVKWQLKKDF